MTEEELGRLSKGKSILDMITKKRAQIEALDKCKRVKIFESAVGTDHAITFDIHTGDDFYPRSLEFIAEYRAHLCDKLTELENEFKEI